MYHVLAKYLTQCWRNSRHTLIICGFNDMINGELNGNNFKEKTVNANCDLIIQEILLCYHFGLQLAFFRGKSHCPGFLHFYCFLFTSTFHYIHLLQSRSNDSLDQLSFGVPKIAS